MTPAILQGRQSAFHLILNGHIYDSFVMYVDGFIKLGPDSASSSQQMLFTAWTQPPQGGPFNNTIPGDTSLIFPLGGDYWGVNAGTGIPIFTVSVSGSPGSQVCTIQWKNLTEKTQTLLVQTATSTVLPQFDTLSFQVKLYETTNIIEFVYGRFVPSTNPSQARFGCCGIKGNNTPAVPELLTMTKGSVANWGIAAPNTQGLSGGGTPLGNYNFTTSNALNYGNNVVTGRALPDPGRTYQFGPVVFNDLSMSTIYAMGKVALPCYIPDSIRVNINNPGVNTQTGVTVTLDITGANTYSTTATITSISGGGGTASVAFAPFIPTALGENLITISVPSDDNNGNNIGHYGFSVTDRYMAYTDSLQPVGQSQGSTVTMNFWGARYNITGTRIVSQVRAYILANSNAEGDTVAGFVIDDTGKILGRSPNYIVQLSDLGTFITFNITVPPTITNGSFIAGICGGAIINPLVNPFTYYLGAYQLESPARSGAYVSIIGSSAGLNLTNAAVGQNFYFTPTMPPNFTNGRLMMECTVDPLPDNDIGIIDASPISQIKIPVNTTIPLRAIIRNHGLLTQPAGLEVRYSINGGPVVGPAITSASVNSLDTISVDFTGADALNFTSAGTYNVKIYTSLSGDGIIGNDSFSITYSAEAPATIPYRISNNILGSWTVQNPTAPLWKQRSAVQANGIFDFNVLWADNITSVNVEGKVISPPFDFSAATHPMLHFNVAHAGNTFPGTDDTLEVIASIDGGTTYTSLFMRSGLNSTPMLATDTAILASYQPAYASDWRHETVNLASLAGQPYVLLAFKDKSASGNGVYIGDISLTDATTISSQPIGSPSLYSSNNVYVTFSGVGDPAGELNITSYNSAPVSTASPVFETNTTATTNSGVIFTPDNVSATEWHSITYTGINAAFPPSSVPYTVSFDMAAMPGILMTDSLYIMKRANFDASWVPVSSTVAGSMISTAVMNNGFSDFAIGSVASSNPLPVDWFGFTGKSLSRYENYLSWITASEQNNDYFMVERSMDQKTFISIQKVKSQGNSNRTQSYSFVDALNTAATGNMYYRIKQVDMNGKFSYSKILTIRPYIQTAMDVTISNPFEGAPVIYFNNIQKAANMSIVVTDITGKIVIKRSFQLTEGNNEIFVEDFGGVKNGMYFTNIQIDDNQLSTKKLLKVK
jgi:hypothetical protein